VNVAVSINSAANALAAGNYGDTITFANTTNGVGSTTRAAALTVGPPPPVIVSGLSATATNGAAFSYQIVAANNPTGHDAAGLPTGLGVNTASGLISGATMATGSSCVVISASKISGTGSALLIITMQPSFTGWQNLWFTSAQLGNPAISGDTAAPAGDGIPNLLKYAFNLNPMCSGVSALPTSSIIASGGNTYLTLTYTQVISAGDITYTPEVFGDMQTWNSGLRYVAPVSVTPNGDGVTDTVVVQDMMPASPSTPRFIRLMVTGP
jgi:hypothetical protein